MRKAGPFFLGIWLAACGRGGDTDAVPDAAAPTSVCVSDWVVPAGDPRFAASLTVDAPKLLWSLELDGRSGYQGVGPVLSGRRLVLTTSSHLFFVERDGSRVEDVTGRLDTPASSGVTPGPWSRPTTDREGNIYLVAWSGIFSLAADGQTRWQTGFPGTTREFPTALQYPPVVLSTDGVLFAVASDQRVHAVDSRNGAELWSAPAPRYESTYLSRVYGGGGNRLMLYRAGDLGTYVLDATTGATVGPMQQLCTGASAGSIGWTVAVECASGAATFDTCDLPLAADGTVRARGRYYADLVAPGERLVVFDYTPDDSSPNYTTDPRYLTLYNRDGSIAAGPAPAQGWPLLVGADGTIYASECVTISPLGTTALRILAYSRELAELWRFNQPGECGRGIYGAVLDEGGILYVTRDGIQYGTINLFAIQTRSPGLADSSWPTSAHDNHGTAWLGQPVREVLSVDGGIDAAAGAVDSGDDAP